MSETRPIDNRTDIAAASGGATAARRETTPPAPDPTTRPVKIGAFVGDNHSSYFPSLISGFEKETEKKLDIVQIFQSWGHEYEDISKEGFDPFPTNSCRRIAENGSTPFIIWEPFRFSKDAEDITKSPVDIINDPSLREKYNIDTNIDNWAAGLKDYFGPVMISFAHNMNGNDHPWSGLFNGNTNDQDNNGKLDGPENYLKAWKYVRDRVANTNGASNAQWVFSYAANKQDLNVTRDKSGKITSTELSGEMADKLAQYFPGSDQVDKICIQIDYSASQDFSFKDLVKPYVDFLKKTAPDKKLIVSNIGTGFLPTQEWLSAMDDYVNSEAAIESLIIFAREDNSIYSDTPFGTLVSGSKKYPVFDPITLGDLKKEQIDQNDSEIHQYELYFNKTMRIRRSDPDYRLRYALALIGQYQQNPAEKPTYLKKAQEQLSLIPRSNSSFYFFSRKVVQYHKAQMILAKTYVLEEKADEALSIYNSIVNDESAETGYKLMARLGILSINNASGSMDSEEMIKEYDSVIKEAEALDDPFIESESILGKISALAKAKRFDEAKALISNVLDWEGIDAPGLAARVFGLAKWAVMPITDKPFYVSDMSYFAETGSVFFDQNVWTREVRLEALLSLAELMVHENKGPEECKKALSILNEIKALESVGASKDFDRIERAILAAEAGIYE